jgi:hypothetical protein
LVIRGRLRYWPAATPTLVISWIIPVKTCHAALEGSEICRKNLVSGNLDLTKDHLVETPGRNTSADRVELVWQRPEGVPV